MQSFKKIAEAQFIANVQISQKFNNIIIIKTTAIHAICVNFEKIIPNDIKYEHKFIANWKKKYF